MSQPQNIPAEFNAALWQRQIAQQCVDMLKSEYFMIRRYWLNLILIVLPALFGLIGTVLTINATLAARLTDRVTALTSKGGPVDRIEAIDRALKDGSNVLPLVNQGEDIEKLKGWVYREADADSHVAYRLQEEISDKDFKDEVNKARGTLLTVSGEAERARRGSR